MFGKVVHSDIASATVTGFVRGSAWEHPLIGEVPVLCNAVTAKRLDRRYRVVSFGVSAVFWPHRRRASRANARQDGAMAGDPQVARGLRECPSFELAGQRQYLLHASTCLHRGVARLGK